MIKRLLSTAKQILKNSQIPAKNIYLISKNGDHLGQRNLEACLKSTKGLDLIQVSSSSPLGEDIPTVKEFMIEVKRKSDKSGKVGVKTVVKRKEIGIKSCIDDHDKCIKVNKIIGYLEKGYQVRLTIGRKKSKQLQRTVSDLYKNIMQDLNGYNSHIELENPAKIEIVYFPKSQ